MRSGGRIAAVAGLALMSPIAPAIAADVGAQYYEMAGTPYEFASGWYLRGDIGYTIYSTPSASFDAPGYGNMKDESLTNTGVAGFGFGYQLNDYLRSDVTFDYRWPADFHGKLRCPAPCTGDPDPEYSDEYASIGAWTTLFNVYYDIGTWSNFTPYVGAGIGTAYLTTTDVHYRNPNGTTGKWNGASEWNFAWALTLGTSYAINNNWLIDASYRYVGMGDAVSGKTLSSFKNKPIHYDNIDAQELRVGLRYLIN